MRWWILDQPCLMNSNKEYRKNWARLIQKIYEVDPLKCAEPVLSADPLGPTSKDAKARCASFPSSRTKMS